MLRLFSLVRQRRFLINSAYVATLVAGASAIGLLPYGRVSENGAHVLLLDEFGAGVPITQFFTAQSDGLHAIRVQLAASRRADVKLEYRLSVERAGTPVTIHATRVIRDLSAPRWVTLNFAEIERSSGSACVLELRATDVRGDAGAVRPSVALVASPEWPTHGTYMEIGGKERTGSLKFETRATGDTLFGRLVLRTFSRLQMLMLIAALAIYGTLFLPLITTLLETDDRHAVEPPRRGTRRFVGVGVCVLLAAALGGTVMTMRAERGRINLIDELYQAGVYTSAPPHMLLNRLNVEIGVDTKRSIVAHSTTRLTWRLTVPPAARLNTAIAIAPVAWDLGGDGVVFRVLAGGAGATSELFMRHVDPHHVPADRHWIPVDVDLGRFAGQPIDLTLVTEPSLPPVLPDPAYDLALWGEPRIVR